VVDVVEVDGVVGVTVGVCFGLLLPLQAALASKAPRAHDAARARTARDELIMVDPLP
jgi:hypothetical protein